MTNQIESIYLGNESFTGYDAIGDKYVSNLSKINLFIGANNSGKSRFARLLFEKDDLSYFFKHIDIRKINQLIEEFRMKLSDYHDRNGLDNFHGIKSEILERLHPIIGLDRSFNFDSYLLRHLKALQTVNGNQFSSEYSRMFYKKQELERDLRKLGTEYLRKFEELGVNDFKGYGFKRIYIPTLRGLRAIGYNSGVFSHEDIYLKRTLRDYFKQNIGSDQHIHTGLSLYEDAKALLLGTRRERNKIKAFEEFLSVSFFSNQEVNIIPHRNDDVVHVLIGNREYPIYALGDGIQAIILLTYPLFFNQGKEMQFFIEEPEHYLHPGFQRIFLETLLNDKFHTYQYFITTHSNHFLDITLDFNEISIYTFKGESIGESQKFIIENVENEDANILELLGVRNASVFLSNCTIWVEGITDRIYIRKYLQVYQDYLKEQKRFKEDTHYSFVEYGGGNITHWSFLNSSDKEHQNIAVERLCGKLFLVSDKDGAGLDSNGKPIEKSSKKYQRHLELKKNLGERYYCLKSREIENTLSPNVLKSTIKDYAQIKKNVMDLEFTDFEYSNYKGVYIGEFIDKHVKNINRSFAAKSGTVKDKVNFAKKAIQHIHNFEDLTEDAKALTKSIYNFICSNN